MMSKHAKCCVLSTACLKAVHPDDPVRLHAQHTPAAAAAAVAVAVAAVAAAGQVVGVRGAFLLQGTGGDSRRGNHHIVNAWSVVPAAHALR